MVTDEEFYSQISSRTYDAIKTFSNKPIAEISDDVVTAKISVVLLEYATELAAANEFFYSEMLVSIVRENEIIKQKVSLAIKGRL